MRWPAWLRRGEPSDTSSRDTSSRDRRLARAARARVAERRLTDGAKPGAAEDRIAHRWLTEHRVAKEDVLGWWFAGGAHSRGLDPTPGTVQVEPGVPEPGRRGLHASPSIIAALAHTQTAVLCRVRLGGTIVSAGDQIAATERKILASTDASATLRALTARWSDRALGAAMESPEAQGASEHRRLAQSARERVIDAEERLRDAQWVLEEGAGRAGGAARARALGEREGARRAVQEARAAAYAHEAAAQLADGSDARSMARAIELVIEALVTFERDPSAHAAVRASLDREIEDALRDPLAASTIETAPSTDRYEEVDPLPAPHRGEASMHAIERTLAAHTGVRGVHPLVLDESSPARVSLVLRCDTVDTARRAVDAVDESVELRAIGAQAIGVWGSHQRGVASRALRQSDPDEDPMRPSRQAGVRDALEHPPLARDGDGLVRAWLVREPEVASASWIAEDVLCLRFGRSSPEACEILARLASHYPRACGYVAVGTGGAERWLVTRAALDALERARVELGDAREGTPIYTKSCGLADPARVVRPDEPVRALSPSARHVDAPRVTSIYEPQRAAWPVERERVTWMSAVGALCRSFAGEPDAWALGGDAELAERFRRARVLPVAVSLRDADQVRELARRAEHDPDLEELRIGVVAVTRAFAMPAAKWQWALDRRVRRAIGEGWIPRVIDRVHDPRPQPFVYPPPWDRDARDMMLRWHLAAFDEVECAAWLHGPRYGEGLLAVCVRDEHVMPQVEIELECRFPTLALVQVTSAEPEPRVEGSQPERVRKGSRLEPSVDAASLLPVATEALACPDVYHRDWMLAAPPDPPGNARERPRRPPHALRMADHLGAPNARCPRCDLAYRLPFGTPLGETRCGLCGNACLVPTGMCSGPYLPDAPPARAYRCPSCGAQMNVALHGGAIHARCSGCRSAVHPVRDYDD